MKVNRLTIAAKGKQNKEREEIEENGEKNLMYQRCKESNISLRQVHRAGWR